MHPAVPAVVYPAAPAVVHPAVNHLLLPLFSAMDHCAVEEGIVQMYLWTAKCTETVNLDDKTWCQILRYALRIFMFAVSKIKQYNSDQIALASLCVAMKYEGSVIRLGFSVYNLLREVSRVHIGNCSEIAVLNSVDWRDPRELQATCLPSEVQDRIKSSVMAAF